MYTILFLECVYSFAPPFVRPGVSHGPILTKFRMQPRWATPRSDHRKCPDGRMHERTACVRRYARRPVLYHNTTGRADKYTTSKQTYMCISVQTTLIIITLRRHLSNASLCSFTKMGLCSDSFLFFPFS